MPATIAFLVLSAAAVEGEPATGVRDEGWYVSGFGAGMIPDENNILFDYTGWQGSLAAGRLLDGGRYRLELEFTRRHVGLAGLNGVTHAPGDFNAQSGFVNVYYTFRPGKLWNPYIAAGAGYSQQHYQLAGLTDEQQLPITMDDYTTNFVHHYIIGVDRALSHGWYVHAEARYFTLEDKELTASFGTWMGIERSYQAGIGFSYRFGR